MLKEYSVEGVRPVRVTVGSVVCISEPPLSVYTYMSALSTAFQVKVAELWVTAGAASIGVSSTLTSSVSLSSEQLVKPRAAAQSVRSRNDFFMNLYVKG